MATRSPVRMPSACNAPAKRATRSPSSRKVRLRSPKQTAKESGRSCIDRCRPCVRYMFVSYQSIFLEWANGRKREGSARLPKPHIELQNVSLDGHVPRDTHTCYRLN